MLTLNDKLALLDSYLEQFSDEEFAERLDSYGHIGPIASEFSSMLKSPAYQLYYNAFDTITSDFKPTILNRPSIVFGSGYQGHLIDTTYFDNEFVVCANDTFYGISQNDENYCCAA